MSIPDPPGPGEQRAWGWVQHLRGGGTTPWAEWTAAGDPRGRIVPGAQQLELLRRLNLAGSPSERLVDRVLEASAPGRGQPDLELTGAVTESAFGPRPVDPRDLAEGELLRVATSVLAEDIVAAGLAPRRRPGIVRPWRSHYRLVGDPELADPIRGQLIARGRPPGGHGGKVIVLGADLGRMLADAWTARAFDTGAPSWRGWLGMLVRRDHLPSRIDLLRSARTWAARVGRDRVHVVLDPVALPAVVGLRRPLTAPAELAAEAPDLARRIAVVLGLHVPADHRTALLRQTLRPLLEQAPGEPLVVPVEHRDWARTTAVRIAEGLRSAGYPVHGDPELLLPGERAGVEAPDECETLALAMRLMLAGAAPTTKEEGG